MKTATEKPHPSLKNPHDAATLIIIRKDGSSPVKVMMGKRHEAHKFMPGKFVFPGGRIDVGDGRIKALAELDGKVEASLNCKMRGRPGKSRARAIAMAAIRETFEETGLIIGRPNDKGLQSRSNGWKQFYRTGYAPCLDQIRFLARAITPPFRPRRFDTRFLVVDSSAVANIDSPLAVETDELLETHWVTIENTADLDLPWITRQILMRLETALEQPDGLAPGAPVSFQYMRSKQWVYETI